MTHTCVLQTRQGTGRRVARSAGFSIASVLLTYSGVASSGRG